MPPNNKTILIVDDDMELSDGLRAVLERQGYRVIQARDGQQGKQQVYNQRPDLVILDMMMPRMGGYPVLEHFKGKADAPPIIMITANEGSRHKAYAEYLGVIDYIRKPFAMERLLEAVEQRPAAKAPTPPAEEADGEPKPPEPLRRVVPTSAVASVPPPPACCWPAARLAGGVPRPPRRHAAVLRRLPRLPRRQGHAADAALAADADASAAQHVAAVRELFEETGVLLARRADGTFPAADAALADAAPRTARRPAHLRRRSSPRLGLAPATPTISPTPARWSRRRSPRSASTRRSSSPTCRPARRPRSGPAN